MQTWNSHYLRYSVSNLLGLNHWSLAINSNSSPSSFPGNQEDGTESSYPLIAWFVFLPNSPLFRLGPNHLTDIRHVLWLLENAYGLRSYVPEKGTKTTYTFLIIFYKVLHDCPIPTSKNTFTHFLLFSSSSPPSTQSSNQVGKLLFGWRSFTVPPLTVSHSVLLLLFMENISTHIQQVKTYWFFKNQLNCLIL